MRDSTLRGRGVCIGIITHTVLLVYLLCCPRFVSAQNSKLKVQSGDQADLRTSQVSESASKATAVKQAWYFPVVPPPGDGPIFYVGPYHTLGGCLDTYGSAIYSHPYACHLTGPHPPSNCRNIGNGFAYPWGYPYPVPADEAIVGLYNGGSCAKRPRSKDDVKPGWYFLLYGPNGSSVEECKDYKADAKLSAYNQTYQLGYYQDTRCPGAPCFSIGFDTACN